MINKKTRNDLRKKRHVKIRKNIHGTYAIPRLNVFRSNSNIYAQLIDDEEGKTLLSSSSLDKNLKIKNGGNKEAAEIVGKDLAKKALAKDIKEVVFDRGGYLYHGRVKALAEAAREAGLKF